GRPMPSRRGSDPTPHGAAYSERVVGGQGEIPSQGLTPLAIDCRPCGAEDRVCFSPTGAAVNSQGCQPLARTGCQPLAFDPRCQSSFSSNFGPVSSAQLFFWSS